MPKRNPIIYLQGPGYSYKQFKLMIGDIDATFGKIIKGLDIRSPSKIKTVIDFYVEASTPDQVRAYARRTSKLPGQYEIRMTAGFSYHLWIASRIFITGHCFSKWIGKMKIKNASFKKLGRKEMVSRFAYEIISYYVLFHELAHIILGHCDYISDEMGVESLNEFEDEKRRISEKEIRIRKAFEAEADRLAGEFTVALFDENLGQEGRGIDLVFPSRVHAYEFYVYTVTIVYVLFQQLAEGRFMFHPKPHERQFIMCSTMWKFVEEEYPDQSDVIQRNTVISMLKAGRNLGLKESGSVSDGFKTAHGLTFVDDVVNETSIRKFQHQCRRTAR